MIHPFLVALPLVLLADERRPLTVDDLWAVQRVGSPTISPDGTTAVFPVTAWSMDDNKSNSDLWSVALDEPDAVPRQLTFQSGSDSAPVFRPDGGAILFASKRGDGPSQLHLLPVDGGEATRLTDLPFSPEAPKWSPDGGKVYFAGLTWPDLGDDFDAVRRRLDDAKGDPVQVKVSEDRLVRFWDHYKTDGRVHHLFELDVESGNVRDLTPGSDRMFGFRGASFDLSPDGATLAFAANVTERPYRTLNFDVHLLDIASGAIDNITSSNPASDGSPVFRPDGGAILYTRGRRVETAPDFSRLCVFDLATRRTHELPLELDASPSGHTYASDGATIVFHAQSRGRVHLYASDGEDAWPIARGGHLSGVAAGSGGVLVYARQSITRPAELYRMHLHGDDETRLTGFNDELFSDVDAGEVEDVTFQGADGDDVQMFLTYPPGFDPSRKWPLLHAIHGGPHGAFTDSFHFRWNQALFAAPGYVVAAVNFHGSTGFGQDFAESILGNHADKPFEDVMKATDHLLAKGFIDVERMAAAGGSYGGYMVSWILGHTDRFQCLINHAGVYDLMAQFASDATWGRANNYGATPWEDPSRIDRYSPSRYASGFDTPTLILHGEKDYRVPYTQGLNLHGVLTAKGVPSRVVIFPDENHWILKPKSAVVWWDQVHGWLDRFIGRGPSPRD